MNDVNLNMDLSRPVVVATEDLDWVASPQPGVERRRLEREGAESGRASSIVRYAPGVSFPAHGHPAGEEYLVLEGTFSDENGDQPAGTYVRNPPGSSHAPYSSEGCTIFVKLCQMQPRGEPQVVIDTRQGVWRDGLRAGHETQRLFEGPGEIVTLERLSPDVELPALPASGGLEILVLQGQLQVNGESHAARTWLRLPAGCTVQLASGTGAYFWAKRGHLAGNASSDA
jgi:quercetin dioxygenase-like cupin family protein